LDSSEQINDAGWRSAALTQQLLVFSRKQIVRPSHIDLNPVIANLEVMLRRIIGEDIALRSSLSPELCPVLADPGQIEQVAMNLVVNARDAMPDGGELVIETSHACLDDAYAAAHVNVRGGAYVVLTVRDTGAGMTEEVKNHLFEPFFTTKGSDKGTGLGLAVVHGIVRDCEGHIEVESQSGCRNRIPHLPACGCRPLGPVSPAGDGSTSLARRRGDHSAGGG
jgi:signal transduction histidine kinase